jgi:Zn-dependent protease
MFTRFTLQQTLLLIPPLLFALTIHELSHGYTAYRLGDPTAKNAGRLTFNPLAHLDLMGTLCIILTAFIGWAKPVPVDPRNFRHPLRGMAIVAAAGPMANFLASALSALVLRVAIKSGAVDSLPESVAMPLMSMLFICFSLNLGLGLFNLLPIPPLDGFRVISVALPLKWVFFCERYSMIFFIALILILWNGAVSSGIGDIINYLQNIVLS